jgi:DNA-binding transcriptional MerR regulator
MADDDRYTAEQLAQLSGVTLRTVRYYVQEGLIDRPEARGPGGHFTNKHLRQLKRCQLLQDWGFDLETIRDKASNFQGILDGFASDTGGLDRNTLRAVLRAMTGDETQLTKQSAAVRAAIQRYRGLTPKDAQKLKAERIPMADGVDLIVDRSGYDMPSPKELVDIALLVRKIFDPLKKPAKDDDDD